MRRPLILAGALFTLASSFVATSHCCARLNVFAAMGLAKPGCLGLAKYQGQFMVLSLVSLAATLWFALFGPGASREAGSLQATALATLATACGLLLFVIP